MTSPHKLHPGGWECALHKDHGSARPVRGEVHHILPKAAGGLDVPDNRVSVCSNGHDACHAAMGAIVHGDPLPQVSRTELAMAREGVRRWREAGEPGGEHAWHAFLG